MILKDEEIYLLLCEVLIDVLNGGKINFKQYGMNIIQNKKKS